VLLKLCALDPLVESCAKGAKLVEEDMHWCGVPALRRFIRIGILLDHQNFRLHRISPRNILLVTPFIRALDVKMIHVVNFRSCHLQISETKK
jgi:hypothetical protein